MGPLYSKLEQARLDVKHSSSNEEDIVHQTHSQMVLLAANHRKNDYACQLLGCPPAPPVTCSSSAPCRLQGNSLCSHSYTAHQQGTPALPQAAQRADLMSCTPRPLRGAGIFFCANAHVLSNVALDLSNTPLYGSQNIRYIKYHAQVLVQAADSRYLCSRCVRG